MAVLSVCRHALQARADVERRLEAAEARLQAAAEKERDLKQRQAALMEKVAARAV